MKGGQLTTHKCVKCKEEFYDEQSARSHVETEHWQLPWMAMSFLLVRPEMVESPGPGQEETIT